MKSILSASVCVAALACAVPAFAADTTDTPKHMHHHHMSKMGSKTHMKKAGDPSTAELNDKSLAAARGGSASTGGDASAPAAAPMTPPASGMMPPASGSTGTTTPTNAPGGGQ